jgi:outer membrane protein
LAACKDFVLLKFMKKLLIKLIPGVLLFCLMSGTASAQVRIATVDLSRVFTNYWKTKQADVSLQDMKAEMAKSYSEMGESFKKEKDTFQKLLADANNQAVSSDERERRKKAADEKLTELRKEEDSIKQFEQQATTRLREQSLRMRDNLVGEIRTVINSKAKAGGYTLVFDTGAQTADRTPVILYSAGEDLTDAVLAQLNAGAPIETSSSEKKGEKK